MDESLAEQLEKLSVHSERPTATSIPSIPAEIIQHILGSLDPTSEDTLTTLLSCQLVSRSFAAASLAPHVWRPLVQARWKRGELKYPENQLPLDEDQQLVDSLFPSPGREAPSEPFAVFRARCKLDALIERHVHLLVSGAKNRLVSVSTSSILGHLVWDRLASITGASSSLTSHWWRRELLRCAARFMSVETWVAIAQGRIVGEEAIELGILAFDAFAPAGYAQKTTAFLVGNAQYMTKGIPRDGERRGSESDNPSEALLCTMLLLEGVYHQCRLILSRTPDLALDRHGNLDEMFLDLAMRRVDLSGGLPESDIKLHPTAFAVIFIAFARRLPAPYELKVELNAFDCFRVSWKKRPDIAIIVDMRCGEGMGLVFDAKEMQDDEPEARWLTPAEVLARYGSHMSHRAPGTDGNASVADGGAAFTAAMMCGSIFGDESTKEHVIPSLLQHFRPPLTHDLPILEHCLLPTLTDRSMVKAAQKVLKIVKSEDTEGIKAQHRPTDGSFNLKLRIGETFHLKSTGECGVIAGWEAREGDRIKAAPRSARGGRGSKHKAAPLRRPVYYVYLAILESHGEYTKPIQVEDADLDLVAKSTFHQSLRLSSASIVGRLFDSWGLKEGFRTPVFFASAETLARWPDSSIDTSPVSKE